jgi:acetoin utilization deacetylase AcuC-like enzyme
MGFCLFNNIAIAARYALRVHHLERVAIVDFDIHHGNGTQDAFYSDGSVLYFYTHQYPYYPGTGRVEEIGEGPGSGLNVNVPLPTGCGDDEFRRVFDEVLGPLLDRFQPQMLFVSAGYDGHFIDPLASMRLSASGYAEMMAFLKERAERPCGGRLLVVLKGVSSDGRRGRCASAWKCSSARPPAKTLTGRPSRLARAQSRTC